MTITIPSRILEQLRTKGFGNGHIERLESISNVEIIEVIAANMDKLQRQFVNDKIVRLATNTQDPKVLSAVIGNYPDMPQRTLISDLQFPALLSIVANATDARIVDALCCAENLINASDKLDFAKIAVEAKFPEVIQQANIYYPNLQKAGVPDKLIEATIIKSTDTQDLHTMYVSARQINLAKQQFADLQKELAAKLGVVLEATPAGNVPAKQDLNQAATPLT